MNIQLKPEQHLELFYQVIDAIEAEEEKPYGLHNLAIGAEINVGTLYNWLNGTVVCPHLRTLFNVAWCLGYEITLQKRKVSLKQAA